MLVVHACNDSVRAKMQRSAMWWDVVMSVPKVKGLRAPWAIIVGVIARVVNWVANRIAINLENTKWARWPLIGRASQELLCMEMCTLYFQVRADRLASHVEMRVAEAQPTCAWLRWSWHRDRWGQGVVIQGHETRQARSDPPAHRPHTWWWCVRHDLWWSLVFSRGFELSCNRDD